MIRRELKQVENKIKVFFDENEACQRLAEIPGIGTMTATALVATVAMANRNVRIAWALMFYREAYDRNYVPLRKTVFTSTA